MKIIFLGTPETAVPILKKLIELNHEIVGVVSQPAKKSGRGLEKSESPVSSFASENNLKIFTPEKLDLNYYEENIVALKPDVAIVVAYGQLIPEVLLNKTNFGWINLHYSLLPQYRGAAPIQRAILNGETKTGITFFQIDKGLDTGLIVKQIEIEVESIDTTESLIEKMNKVALNSLEEVIQDLQKINLIEQKGLVSSAPKIGDSDLKIHWNSEGRHIVNQVRAGSSKLSSWALLNKQKIKILYPVKLSDKLISQGVIKLIDKVVHIGCESGSIEIYEVIPEGKKRMLAVSWLNGIHDKENLKFDE
jgi:methionyl-tRNA formyltransferase